MNFLGILLQQQPAQGGGSSLSFWLMIIAFIAIFYFFLIRPQKKQQKKEAEFRAGLKKGDKVVTTGGIHGKVVEVKDRVIVIDIADHVYTTVEKNFIQPSPDAVQTKAKEKPAKDEEPKRVNE